MKDLNAPLRPATAADGPALADFIHAASEGLAFYTWTKNAEPGEDPWQRGIARQAATAEKWIIAEENGAAVAGLRGELLPEEPETIGDDFEPTFRPLQELENAAPGTWYVHVLATREDRRGQGWGGRLLTLAEEIARGMAAPALSIIVADNNAGARRLYERFGFREVESRPMVKGAWQSPGRNWILMLKPLAD